MNINTDIKYEPLRNVLYALEYDFSLLDDEEKKQNLRERGFDIDASIANVKKMVSNALQEKRITWKETAQQNLVQLKEKAGKAFKWVNQSYEEIEEAFGAVVSGKYGLQPQLQLRGAWKNLKELSIKDKAAILDSIEILKMSDSEDEKDGQTKI